MSSKTFIVTYKTWVSEGNNYAGWSGEKILNVVIVGEAKMIEWLAQAERGNDPRYGNHPKTIIKVEVAETTDVTEKLVEAGKQLATAQITAERKLRAAELRAEAKKIEEGH